MKFQKSFPSCSLIATFAIPQACIIIGIFFFFFWGGGGGRGGTDNRHKIGGGARAPVLPPPSHVHSRYRTIRLDL